MWCFVGKVLKYLTIMIAFVLIFGSCGEETSLVEIEIDDVPYVYSFDQVIYDGEGEEKTITAPFIQFSLSVRNNYPSQSFVLRAIVIRLRSATGVFETFNELLPTICRYDISDAGELYNPCNLPARNVWVALRPGASKEPLDRLFYVEGLPEQGNKNVKYQLELEVLGFLSDEQDPNRAIRNETARLPKTAIRFSTRSQ